MDESGAIRPIPAGEQARVDEVVLTALEAEVLERYRTDYRGVLLGRWRAGQLALHDGRLVDAKPAVKNHARAVVKAALERGEHERKRRREGAAARARNRELRRRRKR